MATLSQVTDYIRENITIWTEEDEVFIKNFEDSVRERGLGTYVVDFSRGDADYDFVSNTNIIDEIFAKSPDYFQELTTPEEYEEGIVCGEEQVFFNITSLD